MLTDARVLSLYVGVYVDARVFKGNVSSDETVTELGTDDLPVVPDSFGCSALDKP